VERQRVAVAAHEARQPEVEHLHRPVVGDEHVARLEVPVDHAPHVRVLHRVAQVRQQRHARPRRARRRVFRERPPSTRSIAIHGCGPSAGLGVACTCAIPRCDSRARASA
jgi:hypothetical protein